MEKRSYPRLGEEIFQETLKNGLRIMVVPRRGFSKKMAYFAADYGAIHTQFTMDGVAYTTPAGVAHYLEHKMFDMPDGEVSGAFAALGANVNAFTGYDMTAYHITCTERFEEALALLLDFVSTPYFTPESVEKEQGIIGQEIEMNADSPDAVVFERLMACMYENHPIRVPILGTRASIGEITPEVLTLCHKAFYHPANMLLCVVGDVDPERVCRLAEAHLPQEKQEKTSRTESWQESFALTGHDTRAHMEVAMPMFQLGFKCRPVDWGEAAIRRDSQYEDWASDIDEDILDVVYENALRAGVEEHLNIFCADVRKIEKPAGRRGTVVCNPPYGERLMTPQEAEALYRDMGRAFANLSPWQIYIITSHPQFERHYGMRADKIRKLYNGMIPCNLYQYFKPKNK